MQWKKGSDNIRQKLRLEQFICTLLCTLAVKLIFWLTLGSVSQPVLIPVRIINHLAFNEIIHVQTLYYWYYFECPFFHYTRTQRFSNSRFNRYPTVKSILCYLPKVNHLLWWPSYWASNHILWWAAELIGVEICIEVKLIKQMG